MSIDRADPQMDEAELTEWWAGVERSAPVPADEPTWRTTLRRLHEAELAGRLDEARDLASQVQVDPAGPFSHVLDLLKLRLIVRSALPAGLDHARRGIEAMLAPGSGVETPTRARAWQLLAVLNIRLDRWDEVERCLDSALRMLGPAPSRLWVIDGWIQRLLAMGAWEEGRRSLHRLLVLRRAEGDRRGLAITTGHLARLEILLGRPSAARDTLEGVFTEIGGELDRLSSLRLLTAKLEAALDEGLEPAIGQDEIVLEQALARAGAEGHYLEGFAWLALARATAHSGREELGRERLAYAALTLRLPDQVVLLRMWEARLMPGFNASHEWLESMEPYFHAAALGSEAEIRSRLLRARRAALQGDHETVARQLDLADTLARKARQPHWLRWVDDLGRQVDPEGSLARKARRFTGSSLPELGAAEMREASIVFLALPALPETADSSPESTLLDARSFLELAASFFEEAQVRPLAFVGHGLFGVADGPDHARRAVGCARRAVLLGQRIGRLRGALGESRDLAIGAAVSGGALAMGAAGSLLKLEVAAVGPALEHAMFMAVHVTPGEVLSSRETAREAGFEGFTECEPLRVSLGSVPVIRWDVRDSVET